MNLVECCTSYAADASSTVKQHTAQTQHKHSTNTAQTQHKHSTSTTQTHKQISAQATNYAKIANNTKINNLSV